MSRRAPLPGLLTQEKLTKLQRECGYQFADQSLLTAALTHRSAGRPNNERLEFLGDGAVNFIIGAALFRQHKQLDEGRLTRLRASLVRGETLAALARELNLGHYLVMGSGELKSGGFNRDSVLADVFEAVVGAIYLDSNFNTCEETVLKWFGERLHASTDNQQLKDPKTRLQEWLQARGEALPNYQVSAVKGESHAQLFTVHCQLSSLNLQAQGEGPSRRRAEQAAASILISQLEI